MSEDTHNKKSSHPDVLKWVIIGLLGFIAVLLIFGIGMQVGGAKARFSYKWADNYHKNFAGPRSGFMGGLQKFPQRDFIEAHGSFGEIIERNGGSLVLKGRGDVEKIVMFSDKTVVSGGRVPISVNELKVGDQIVVIGSPNEEGQIEAKLIRRFPVFPTHK